MSAQTCLPAKDMLWSRRGLGRGQGGPRVFWERGWFYGCNVCGRTGPRTQKGLGLGFMVSCHCLKTLGYFLTKGPANYIAGPV